MIGISTYGRDIDQFIHECKTKEIRLLKKTSNKRHFSFQVH